MHRPIFFYTNEHEPIHVHGRYGKYHSRAEIIVENGRVVSVEISDIPGKPPLEGPKLKDFQKLVHSKADDIVRKWIDFFVHNVRSAPEVITRRIK